VNKKLSLAYQFVAFALMVAEANFFCSRTGLPQSRRITESDVLEGSHVGPPRTNDFGGSVITDKYFFGFGWGHLANFRKIGFMPKTESGIRERNLELSKAASQIDTNGAVQLATNWLAGIGVNVPALESKYRRNIIQWKYYPEGISGKVLMLPVYQVEWRGSILRTRPDRESAVVTVTISGITKELVDLSVLDDSLFTRPRMQIKGAERLLAISDEQFRMFSASERSNMVAKAVSGELEK